LIPYLMGKKHPYGKRLVDYQKCVRTNDLEEVGDTTHHTFFEMLGNWSLGDYFKEESISYSYEFLTSVLNIPSERLGVTVFKGDENIPKDEVSAQAWIKQGINPKKIAYLGASDNFWIAGESGPCGSDTEIFYWRSNDQVPNEFDPDDNRWVEIWNNVFMEYFKDSKGVFTNLPEKNVDTGMGLERVVAILEGVNDNYMSSIWQDVIAKILTYTDITYEENPKSIRIIADHLRTSVFILAAGIKPSNTDQGYILRRLIRRSIRHAKKLNIDIFGDWDKKIAKLIIDKYAEFYPEVKENETIILDELDKEKKKFNHTLEKGLKEFEKITSHLEGNKLDKDLAFRLYDTYGFPIELTVELAKEKNIDVDVIGFKEKFKAHQELSRTASKGKFKGGLSGNNEIETKYHTATHLLNAALKQVIGPDVHQKGSNITDERMRFDFSCDHKLSDEEIKKTSDLVNQWINESIPVEVCEMNKNDAIKSGAECMFVEKYPDVVTVYTIGNISKELCGGPHVKNTSSLGHFQIIKEEASSAGVRRIKAILN
jgi:alanyl-tRNA synthetase